jgi:hypothetical protein
MVQRPRPESFFESVKESIALVVAPENRRLSLAWLACVIVVVAIGLRSSVDTASFIGIADSRESNINFDFPVNVVQLNVISGQSVKKGDLIAQVEQPELELKLQEARAELSKLSAERKLVSEMGQLGSLRRVPGGTRAQDASANPLATEIQNLEDQVAVLEDRQKSLYVFAPFDGVVGSVNYKKGETVKPYEPLMTVSPSMPTYIDAFIHEALQTKVTVGQTVTVVSMSDSSRSVEGHIVSMGSRIIELPMRIGRVQTMKMWGREIMIEIPPQNPFLLGEKVQVTHPFLQISFPIARASEKAPKPKVDATALTPQLVTVPPSIKTVSSFEPSGAVYIKDLKKFLVASDDTDKDHAPILFLLGPGGAVDSQVVKIDGLSEIHDVESVLQDDSGTLYLLSSQSANKKGENTRSRDLLIRVKRSGVKFTATGNVELRPLILAAASASKDADLSAIRDDLKSDLEIEAAYLDKDHLKVGLKKPLLKDRSSLVLDLGPIAKLMNSKTIAAADFRVDEKISFPAAKEKKTRISDMAKIGNKLIIATISKKPGHVGRLWAMNMTTKALEKIGEYPNHSPEAVAYDADAKELMVLFDEKDEPALYMKNSSIDFN